MPKTGWSIFITAALGAFFLCAPARAGEDGQANALLVVPSATMVFDKDFQDFLNKNGVKLLQSYPPSVFEGYIPQELDKQLGERYGVLVQSSEIVGLVPRRALEDTAAQYLRIENFRSESVVENRLDQLLNQQAQAPCVTPTSLRNMVDGFVSAVAAPTAVPAGGSAAALAGALAGALAEMVCGVALKRRSLAAHHAVLSATRARLAGLRERLLANGSTYSEASKKVAVRIIELKNEIRK